MSTDKKRSIASLEASDDASSNGVKIEVADQEYIEANESDGDEEANSSGEDGEVLRAKTSKKQKVEKKADVELMKNDEGDVYVQVSPLHRFFLSFLMNPWVPFCSCAFSCSNWESIIVHELLNQCSKYRLHSPFSRPLAPPPHISQTNSYQANADSQFVNLKMPP